MELFLWKEDFDVDHDLDSLVEFCKLLSRLLHILYNPTDDGKSKCSSLGSLMKSCVMICRTITEVSIIFSINREGEKEAFLNVQM